jgi:hypothetical protein
MRTTRAAGVLTGLMLCLALVAAMGQVSITPPPLPHCTVAGYVATWNGTAWTCAAPTGASGASPSLDNLATVAINTALIPGTAGGLTLGTAAKAWSDIYFAGTSGTPGTNHFKITGASTAGLRTVTLPDDSLDLSVTTANQVLATSGSGAGPLRVRALVALDIPSLSGTYLPVGGTATAVSFPVTVPTGGLIQTDTTAAHTFSLAGYNTSGTPAYNPVLTVTAAAGTPTLTLPASIGLTIADGAPTSTTNKLYQASGVLTWNGAAVATPTTNWTRTGTVLSPTTAGDVLSIPDGTSADPGIYFSGDANKTGFYRSAAHTITLKSGGATGIFQTSYINALSGLSAQGVTVNSNGSAYAGPLDIGWRGPSAVDVFLRRADPGVLRVDGIDVDHDAGFRLAGQKSGYWQMGSISELITLSTGGATTDSSANLLPANSIIESVTARVTTTIVTATDWALGDGTISTRFTSANATLTAGTTTIGFNQVEGTGTSGKIQTSAAKLRITTTGTPSAGVIRVTVYYRQFLPPTS